MNRSIRRTVVALALCAGAGTACLDAPLDGFVYEDTNRSSASERAQRIDRSDVRLSGVPVALLGASGEQSVLTDASGRFAFPDAAPGTYLLSPGVDPRRDSTSHNRPLRLPEAIREGAVHVVHFGDSLGVAGPSPHFPERLATRLSAIVPTTVDNLAVSGSRTPQWLPGSSAGFFESRLAPRLPAADVVTITLGGNDVDPYLGYPPNYDPVEIIRAFLENPELLFDILPNIATIVAAIRDINPDCDIVYAIYPNYANSSYIEPFLGELQPLAARGLGIGLGLMRDRTGRNEGIVLADVYGSLGDAWLDEYLIDEVHLSAAGHALFAEEIFRALGGVDADPEAPERRMFGFAPRALGPIGSPGA